MPGEPSGCLRGKSFYLHDVRRHQSITLSDTISRLGGKVDSFLTKDVNVVVTGVREAVIDEPVVNSSTVRGQQSKHCKGETPKPQVCGSRGRALLEKVIHHNERSHSSVLATARSWGVRVYHVDEFLKFVNHLNQKLGTAKKKGNKQEVSRVKAGELRSPYIKVEDVTRKFRPLYAQSLSFPVMSYSGKFSPFEMIPQKTLRAKSEAHSKDRLGNEQEPSSSCHKFQVACIASATRKGPAKKSSGYCECCHVAYEDQIEHFRSEIHRSFIENDDNYAVVDELTARLRVSIAFKPNQEVNPAIIKSPSARSPLSSDFLSEREKSPSVHELPPITDLLPPTSMEHVLDPVPGPANESSQQPIQDVLKGNFSIDTSNHRVQSGALCMNQVPSSIFSKSESTEKNPTSTEAPPHLHYVETESTSAILVREAPTLHEPKVLRDCEKTVSDTNHARFEKTSPKEPLQRQEGGERSCGQIVLNRRTSIPTKQLRISAQLTESQAFSYFSFPGLHPSPQPPFLLVNLRKRSRSFSVSSKGAKRRKLSLRVLSTLSKPDFTPEVRSQAGSAIQTHSPTYLNPPVSLCVSQLCKPCNSESNHCEFIEELNASLESRVASPSDLDPPQLVPYFHEDHELQHHQYHDPPELLPFFSEMPHEACTSISSSRSHSGASVYIESALVPSLTWSPASSESDWDSGLLSWLATGGQNSQNGNDLGLLLEKPLTDVQDGSYASRLCSLLQPS